MNHALNSLSERLGPQEKVNYVKKIIHDSFSTHQLNQDLIALLNTFNEACDSLWRDRFACVDGLAMLQYEAEFTLLCKAFIERLEDKGMPYHVRKKLEAQGVHKILYHYAEIKASKEYTEQGASLLKKALFHLFLCSLSVSFFVGTAFLGPTVLLPLATALFAAAVAYIAGMLYGILNDILATRSNLPYFLLGHIKGQRGFTLSNSPFIQAVNWGVAATSGLTPIFAALFFVSVFISATVSSAPLATFILPLLLVAIPLLVLVTDLVARYRQTVYLKDKNLINPYHLDPYHQQGLDLMSSSQKDIANWYANSDRNLAGYILVPLTGLGALITLLSLPSAAVPVVLFSGLLSTVIPPVAALIVIIGLALMVHYALKNKEHRIDNKYKLRLFNEPDKSGRLYLNEQQSEAALAHSKIQ